MIVVFINGCFDILHRGHLELFKYASNLGDKVVVAIDSDEKVRKDKGPGRPINNLKDRKFFLSRLKGIDEILDFGSREELENLVKQVSPDIMIVGSDWRTKTIVGARYAKEIKFFERISGYSTTKILQNSFNRG
jgi:D-beta-D-heptose 7-phosphate kinase/D-beta-D-heptose 1-phosphate adenosyltransferase